MSSLPRLLAESFFNPVQFPAGEVTAESQVVGHEGFRVGTARRTPRNYWTPDGDNKLSWVQVQLPAARTADMAVLDRGHNLSGETIRIRRSTNGSTWTTVREVTVPATVPAGGTLPGPVRTEEGAVILTWDPASDPYWRLEIPAMGADLRPRVTGLYLGESWRPTQQFGSPFGFGDRELLHQEELTDTGGLASAPPASRRRKAVQVLLESNADYPLLRRHIEEQFLRFHPMWIIWDQEWVERSWLAVAAAGPVEVSRQDGWGYPQATFIALEHDPLPL